MKIILKGPSSSDTPDTIQSTLNKALATTQSDTVKLDATTVKTTGNEKEFYIHKALLSSLSPELDKHTNNDMKEGREGVLTLSDVDGATMEAFMEWAYLKDYTLNLPNTWEAILPHTKVYVLGDRFNITILQDLAFSKIDSLFKSLNKIAHSADIAALMEAVAYGYDNLLFRSAALIPPRTTDSMFDPQDDKIEKLLKYFAQYASWLLETFRPDPAFRKLLSTSTEFSEALIIQSGPATLPPWILQSQVCTKGQTPSQLSISLGTNTNHILHRTCSLCSYTGVSGIKCKGCNKYDFLIGLKVECYGSELGTTGSEKVTGTKTSFQYTCPLCKKTSSYGTSRVNFSHPVSGSSYNSAENVGYLSCRGCSIEGFYGYLSI